MAQLIDLSLIPALDADGVAVSGAELRFFATGTSTPATVYTTDALDIAHPVPLLSNGAGRFPAVYTSGATELRATLTIGGSVVRDEDPINPLLPASAVVATGPETVQAAITRLNASITQNGINVRSAPYSAVGNGTTDDTAAFQAAIDAAFLDGRGLVVVPPGIYRIAGTLLHKPGVTIAGQNYASEYFPGSPYNEIEGTQLLKTATDADGPIIEMATGSAVSGIYFKHLKAGGATTGIVRFGPAASSGECFNAVVTSCQFYGHAITSGGAYANANCHAIFGPESTLSPTRQRYFNRISDVYITNCDRGVSLGGQCNGWTIANLFVRQTYRPIYIDGGASEVADTAITGFHAQNIGILPTAATAVFTLVGAVNILSANGTSECNGVAFDTAGMTAGQQLDFSAYQPNEPTASVLPFSQTPGQLGFLVQQPNYCELPARGGWRRSVLVEPSRTGDRFDFIRGIDASGTFNIGGSLPQANGGAGPSQALVAANASSRVLLRFQNLPYKVSAHPVLHCRLTVICDGPGTSEASFASTEFVYRRTTTTGPGAGSLTVFPNPIVEGAGIGGLHFIHGKTGDEFFGIALVGGGSTASAFTYIVVKLEILTLDAETTVQAREWFTNISTTAVAASANDVTNHVTLLTAGDTAI